MTRPDARGGVAGALACPRRARRSGPTHPVRLRVAAAVAQRGALLAAASMPLLLGLAAATAPEPVTLGLAGLALAWLSLRMQRLRTAERASTQHRNNLARLTAPAIARLVAETDSATLRAGWELEATVLFADICGFTRLCEGLAPGDVAAFLGAFRARAAQAIESADGLVDKFVGDEVMAVFGAPDSSQGDAYRAIMAARSLTAAMSVWSRERSMTGLPPVRVGIGLHRGPIFLGAIGTERVEFTAVGDTVNVARRFEQMTRTLACDCLASEAVVRDARVCGARAVAVRPVRGRCAVLQMFAIELAK